MAYTLNVSPPISNHYRSLADITSDPRGRALAFAQDMSYTDWCNFHIKNFIIRERVLNQPVRVDIDGEMVILTNPDTLQPLVYADFITDRSGPKFGGYLNDQPATEYLSSNLSAEELTALMERQKERTIEYCRLNDIEIPDDEVLNQAIDIFAKKHTSQRKLSDYDLTARDTDILERAIILEVEKRLDPEQAIKLRRSPEFSHAIGKTAWRDGGIINMSIIKEIFDVDLPPPQDYAERVRGSMIHPNDPNYVPPNQEGHDPERAFTHMLIEDVGKTVRQEYIKFYQSIGQSAPIFFQSDSSAVPDTYYGLGIPFNEASIDHITDDGEITLTTDKEAIEIGDIICDNSSIFGKVFNSNKNFDLARQELIKSGISEELIDEFQTRARTSSSNQMEFFRNTLAMLANHGSLTTAQREKVVEVTEKFEANEQFIESGLMFEESGKKEGQSQLFQRTGKDGKLIGNISDTGPFMIGVIDVISNSSDPEKQQAAKAHQQITILATLISVTRWGIDDSNHHLVGDTGVDITAEAFQKSLNTRSYQADDSTGIREKLNLANISVDEAQARMMAYKRGFEPVWQSIRDNKEYFLLVSDYSNAKNALKVAQQSGEPAEVAEAQIDYAECSERLTKHIEKMLSEQMPELSARIDMLAPDEAQREVVIRSIVNQLDEAIEFGHNRILVDQKRQQAAQQASEPELPSTVAEIGKDGAVSKVEDAQSKPVNMRGSRSAVTASKTLSNPSILKDQLKHQKDKKHHPEKRTTPQERLAKDLQIQYKTIVSKIKKMLDHTKTSKTDDKSDAKKSKKVSRPG